MKTLLLFGAGVLLSVLAAGHGLAQGASRFDQDLAALARFENRLSGLEGNQAAVDHIANRLRQIGVDDVFIQEFPSAQVVNNRCEIELGGAKLFLQQIRPNGIVPPVTPPEGIQGEILHAGKGTMADYGEVSPLGKIVVLDYNSGETWLRAFRLGAKAVIFTRGEEMQAGQAHFTDANVNLPRFYYNGDPADLTEGATATVRSEAIWEPVISKNVIGLIRGTNAKFNFNAEEAIILSAHLDTFGEVPELTPGARGAANVAGLLETAAFLKANRPRRHTVVAFFNNDARGLEGARMFYRAIDSNIRETAATLPSREASLTEESEFLRKLEAALKTPHPVRSAGDITTQLLNRLRLAADEEIENSRAFMGQIRQQIEKLQRQRVRSTKDVGDQTELKSQIDLLTTELAALEEPHNTWNDFRRALARGELGEVTTDQRYAQVVGIVQGEVASRLREVEAEQRALASDQSLHQALARFIPVLHVSVRFGDTTEKWGIIFGKSSLLGAINDVPGFYGRVLQTFKEAGEALGGRLQGFENTPINPGRQLWGSQDLIHSGEIAGRYGIYNVVIGTALDHFPREGTPNDTVARLKADRIQEQMRAFSELIRQTSDKEGLSASAPIVRHARYVVPRFRDMRVAGSLAMRRTQGSSVANRPAAGAIVQIFPTPPNFRLRTVHPEIVYNPKKPIAFDNFIVARANANGSLAYGPVNPGVDNEYGLGILFNGHGQATAISDHASAAKVGSRLNLFVANHGAVVAPPHLLAGLATVMDGRTNSVLDLTRSFSATSDGVVWWYSEPRVSSVKVFGTHSAVVMNIGKDDHLDLAGAGYGRGWPMGSSWTFPRISATSSGDLFALNESRLQQLRARGVSNLSVEELNARAEDLMKEGENAAQVKNAESFLLSSFLTSVPVYENVRRNLDDLVKSVLVLLALAIPFAFALERLLIGSPSIYKQIAWFVSFFLATFLLLYFTHPAFAVSNAPLIIFLGFTILVLSALVIFIIMQKFEVELKHMQGMASTVHSADVSRFSTIMAAMSMGISTMRRRPVRTALTAITIILLTFTILCFASFGGSLGVNKRFIGPLPGYSGALIHRINWAALDQGLLDVLAGRWNGEETITARYWISPETASPSTLSLARMDGSRPALLQGLLGLSSAEIQRRRDLAELFGEPSESFDSSIWMTSPIGEVLGVQPGDTVRLNGRLLTVAPFVDSNRLASAKDMDGSSILPVDFLTTQSLMGTTTTATEAESQEIDGGSQNWETIGPDSLVIVSDTVARSLFAKLRAITLYTDESSDAERLADDAARMFGTPIAATREDGVYWHRFGNVLAASGVKDLMLPILLGGLVVFGTMLGSVADREKEIYTFSALGLAPPHVASLFFAEALVFSVIGGLGGYLTAQAILEGLKVLAAYGLATVPEINYSSTNAIVTILIVMGTVIISAIYPAIKASRSANPGVLRSWKMPPPEGDRFRIVFPFTVSAYDLTGVVSFLKEHFENFQDTGLGAFLSKEVRLTKSDDGNPGVACHLALAPFDLGVTQEFSLHGTPSEIPGIDEVQIVLQRKSGQPKDWQRLNKVLLDDLRKQFLIWRSLPSEVMETYRSRTLQAVGQTASVFSPTPEGGVK